MNLRAGSRREFLAEVGRCMLVAGVGNGVVRALEPRSRRRIEWMLDDARLSFGARDRLVGLVVETPVDRLLPLLARLLKEGTDPKELVAAAALGNARAFGGEDYVGFHTFMAMAPAWQMATELPPERRALPILKVLHRNAVRLSAWGDATKDVLKPLDGVVRPDAPLPDERSTVLRDAVHAQDLAGAERAFATAARHSLAAGWNQLLGTVHEALDVHRVVLAHRAWDMMTLAGEENGRTLLRQSLHYCVKNEAYSARQFAGVRALLPKLLDGHQLLGRKPGVRAVDDAWLEQMSMHLFDSTGEQAADAVAAALADDVDPEAVADAIGLAANQLMLRDAGRSGREVQPGKPAGSVHGDSIGIHASDSAHAWRHIARVSDDGNRFASLILAGYQVASDRVNRGGKFLEWTPRPGAEALAKVSAKEPRDLLSGLDGAIRDGDQELACAVARRYLDLDHPPRAAFDLLREHAIKADGALHAEKYYWTTSSEFARARPAFQSRHLVALARASASQSATPSPAYDESLRVLGL